MSAPAPIMAVQAVCALLPLCPAPWCGWHLLGVPWDVVVMGTWGMWMWGHEATGKLGGAPHLGWPVLWMRSGGW